MFALLLLAAYAADPVAADPSFGATAAADRAAVHHLRVEIERERLAAERDEDDAAQACLRPKLDLLVAIEAAVDDAADAVTEAQLASDPALAAAGVRRVHIGLERAERVAAEARACR